MFKLSFHEKGDAWSGAIYGTSSKHRIRFCMPVIKGNKIQLVEDPTACREVLLTDVSDTLTLQEYEHVTHTPLLVAGKSGPGCVLVKKRVLNAVRLLHIFERYMGWKKTSLRDDIDRRVNGYKLMPGQNIFLLIGPKQWLDAPYMLSLYTLIIRLSRLPGLSKIRTLTELYQHVTKLHSNLRQFNNNVRADLAYYYHAGPVIKVLLDNYTTIFGSVVKEQIWELDQSWKVDTEGIGRLATGQIMDKHIVNTMEGICEKANVLYPVKTLKNV